MVNNIEELMRELMRSSVLLKRKLYRKDEAASTAPAGTDGPRTMIHFCRVCGRAAAGKEAQVHHEPKCALARLQRAQAALREASPEMFAARPVPGEADPPAASDKRAPMSSLAVPAVHTDSQPPVNSVPPVTQASPRRVRQRNQPAQLGAVHQGTPVPAAPVYVPPSQVRRALGGHSDEQRNA